MATRENNKGLKPKEILIKMNTKTSLRAFSTTAILALSIILLAITQAYAGGNTKIESFSKAKKLLLKQVCYDHRTTFYCGCPFTADKQIIPSDKFCPSTKYVKRSRKVEWEHVVPAEAFGHSFSEWRDGAPGCVNRKGKAFKGRKCAEKVNMAYRHMQADMYNLVPANGQINALRSNYSYAMISGEPRCFGKRPWTRKTAKQSPSRKFVGILPGLIFT